MASVPTKAVWVDGKKGKGKVLLDKAGFRLRYKKKDGGKKYFICPRKEDTQSMVEYGSPGGIFCTGGRLSLVTCFPWCYIVPGGRFCTGGRLLEWQIVRVAYFFGACW